MMKLTSFILFMCMSAANVFAATIVKGTVTLESGEKVYRMQVKGESKAPPIVFVNGIVYDLSKWDKVFETLAQNEMNAMIYALPGQPENLKGVKRWDGMAAMLKAPSLKDLAVNLAEVLRATGLADQKVVLFGASFGVAPAAEFSVMYPDQVAELVFGVPLIVPLDQYDPNGAVLRSTMKALRANESLAKATTGMFFPWLAMNEHFWSDLIQNQLTATLLDMIVKVVPEGVDSELYKQGMFNLLHAVSDFDLNTYASRLKNVHVVVATEDVRDAIRDQYAFWSNLAPSSRESLLVVNDSHLLPEASPRLVATWLTMIAQGSEIAKHGTVSRVEGQHLPVGNAYNPGGQGGGKAGSATTAPAAPTGPTMGISPELKKKLEAEAALIRF
jgi:pimeloyl-ACP methyl ester carboxylesterase